MNMCRTSRAVFRDLTSKGLELGLLCRKKMGQHGQWVTLSICKGQYNVRELGLQQKKKSLSPEILEMKTALEVF